MEVETSKNGLMTVPKSNSYELASVAEGSGIRKVTNLDVNDENDQNLLLSAMEECDFLLNDCVGKTLDIIGYYFRERLVDSYDEDTGEQITRKKHQLILFDKNNNSYVTGSNACFNSFSNIVSLKGEPTRDNILKIDVINTSAKDAGHKYLKLKIHVDKGE